MAILLKLCQRNRLLGRSL